MARSLTVLCLCLPTLAGAAGADAPQITNGWSFAHWGMTMAQVRAASGGQAHAPSLVAGDSDNADTVDGGTQLGPYKFTVTLQYAGVGGLDSPLDTVELDLQTDDDKQCIPLKAYMTTRLGPHHTDGVNGHYVTSEWKVGQNKITVERMRGISCEIRIEPLEWDAQ